jgi:uncharacterized membrane protein YfcA
MTMLLRVKIFIVGAVLGAVFGATLLASIAHLLLIGLAVVGTGAVLVRGRRLVSARPGRDHKQLEG